MEVMSELLRRRARAGTPLPVEEVAAAVEAKYGK